MCRRIHYAVLTIVIIALLIPTITQAQTGIGIRAGKLGVDGNHVHLDTKTAFGAHLALGFIPILKFQVGIEFLSGKADYDYYSGITANNKDFTNVGVFIDVRFPIKLLPLFPIKPVVGGGVNYNLMTYLTKNMVEQGSLDPGFGEFTHMGYHWMAGLMFDPPILPFVITAEYRFQSIKLEDDTITIEGFLVGLTFGI